MLSSDGVVLTSCGKSRGICLRLVGTIYEIVTHPALITYRLVNASCRLVQKSTVSVDNIVMKRKGRQAPCKLDASQ